jgi:FkbM family methyltransferase
METYSQIGQDLFVLEFFKNLADGYFVEIGASDGITLSNTYLLEKNYNWKGVCIEPGVDEFVNLQKNRKCHCVSKAVYSKSGLKMDFVKKANGLLSGLKEHYDFETWKSAPTEKVYTVETETLTDILDRLGAPKYIQYMSLDTEGAEVEILKGIDFSKYTFGLLNVEHNYNSVQRNQQKEILEANGYRLLKQNQFDDYYYFAKGNYNAIDLPSYFLT